MDAMQIMSGRHAKEKKKLQWKLLWIVKQIYSKPKSVSKHSSEAAEL